MVVSLKQLNIKSPSATNNEIRILQRLLLIVGKSLFYGYLIIGFHRLHNIEGPIITINGSKIKKEAEL